MQKRIASYDYMKAFAIWLVVMDHLISASDSIDNSFRAFIYSLHMPLFFIVSGFLASRKLDNFADIKRSFTSKSRLLIPVIVFGLGDVIILGNNISGFFGWNKFGLWFLWTLFLFFALYSISQVLLVHNRKTSIEIFVLFIPVLFCIVLRLWQDTFVGGIFNFLNLYNYVFFILGVIIARYDLKKFILRDDVQFGLLIAYVIGLATGLPALNIPMKACGILFFYGCFDKITNSNLLSTSIGGGINSLILCIGKNTLFIYILHFYFIRGIGKLPHNIHDLLFSIPCYYLSLYTVISFTIIFACILIKEVVCTNKWVRILAFGMKN